MESWFIIILTLCFSSSLIFIFNLLFQNANLKSKKKLPPGPFTFPVIGSLVLLGKRSLADIEVLLHELKCRYGPLILLKIGFSPSIFVSSHSLAYQALVHHGAACSDRPNANLPTNKIFTSDRTISNMSCGPTWRLLRRNLRLEMLHPSLIRSQYQSQARALSILIQRLHANKAMEQVVMLVDHIKHANLHLLVSMCFGDNSDEAHIKKIKDALPRALSAVLRFKVLDFFPIVVSKLVFRESWKELNSIREELEEVFVPLIHDRLKYKEERAKAGSICHKEEETIAYIDRLVNLELPEEKRRLTHEEIVSLCVEFLGAASDTTSTSLQWIMANLVKYPSIQEKLYKEICDVKGEKQSNNVTEEAIRHDDLPKIPYLRAVILEGLRRHPPSHFLLPHRVSEEMELNGYTIPKNATIYFMAREMGLDPKVWQDPMEFKPERFLMSSDDEPFDVTGSKEIKMMPFGVGRRICPGYAFALLHLEYLVANLIWHFEWKAVKEEAVDLTEESDFTFTMKYPLQARNISRMNSL